MLRLASEKHHLKHDPVGLTLQTAAAGGACTSLHGGPKTERKGLSRMCSFCCPELRHHIKYHISLPLGRVREECVRSVSRKNRLQDPDLIVDILWGFVLRATTLWDERRTGQEKSHYD